jgi:hypothetical protein
VLAGDSVPRSGAFRAAFDVEYLTASAASDDNAAATESIIQTTFRPVLVWSPIGRLNLVLQVPVTNKNWTLTGGGENESADHTGLGDVDFGARWFLWENINLSHLRRQNLALSAGTSFPTGPDNATLNGQPLDEHAQLGTGSFGPYAGVLYAFHQDPWNVTANVSGRVHSTNPHGYQYGPALLFGVRGTYLLKEWLGFVFGIDGRYAARDTSGGVHEENTGGFLLAAVPGVTGRLGDQLWLLARAQLPFYEHLFGVQRVGPVVTANLQYTFR